MTGAAADPIVRLRKVRLEFGATRALDDIDLDIPAGVMVGLIGPDGVGKSSLLSLIAGARAVQGGEVTVLGGDMRDAAHRRDACPRIAYMPQGLGKNLYPTLSVFENVDFFGRLFGHAKAERARRIAGLLESTGLAAFADRPAGKLSGGMKQKLGLCCALIHDPDLLLLDEPTTGVDPLSRRQFWDLIDAIRRARPAMSVIVATAYMEEAARFDWIVAMDDGRVLDKGPPGDIVARTGAASLDAAFIALLPEAKRTGHRAVAIPPRAAFADEIAIAAEGLTMRFDDFVAVDRVSFQIGKGEIFGFLGSNGCGKTTTMKMLTGLLPASEGTAKLFGREIDPRDIDVRRRVGYMSQAFSLYSELTVRQNLEIHARLFRLPARDIPARVASTAERFDLTGGMDALPDALPLGVRQRLSLAVAMIHAPDLLILDEPTSGVDPVARDALWNILIDLARRDGVTIFISTHFMNEAERCDRISLMHAGRVLVSDTPRAIVAARKAATLEAAFVGYLEDAAAAAPVSATPMITQAASATRARRGFDWRRMASYARRESLELFRDPVRATLALLGSVILMFVVGYGINFDVEKLSFAVLDRDGTTASRDFVSDIAGSRYFDEKYPIVDHADLDRRMRAGEISLAIEIPENFARDAARGRDVQIAAWIDGAMPQRAETLRGYVQGVFAQWLARRAGAEGVVVPVDYRIETRFRYNPAFESLIAMVPAVIPLVLMLIPAMLAALSIVREKELGSIVNLYVTPVTRLEFLLGKQLPYIVLSMGSFALLLAVAVLLFRVPFTGSLTAFALGALLYVGAATGVGLLISSFMKSQVAAIFGTAVLTIVPAVQFCGIIDPLSSLEGAGALIGNVFPTSYFVTIARGAFSKGLGFADLAVPLLVLGATAPLLVFAAARLLKKQAD